MGICKVAGGVLQVGFLKIGLWRFAGGIPLVRFLMQQVGIWKVAGGFCMMEYGMWSYAGGNFKMDIGFSKIAGGNLEGCR